MKGLVAKMIIFDTKSSETRYLELYSVVDKILSVYFIFDSKFNIRCIESRLES